MACGREHPLRLLARNPNGVKVTRAARGAARRSPTGRVRAYWSTSKRGSVRKRLRAINPNSKIPALLDRSTAPPTRVFESGAIVLLLAEKFGAFVPRPRSRARARSASRGSSGRWCTRSWRRLRHFYATRPRSSSTRSTLCDGGQAPARRARPPPRRPALPDRRRLHDRRHGDLAVVRWTRAPQPLRRRVFLEAKSYQNVVRWRRRSRSGRRCAAASA